MKASKISNIQEKLKKEKFEKMIQIQEKFIIEHVKQGKNSVLWIFSDKEYYTNDLQKQWYVEFYEKAKKKFIKDGYKINGILIKW
jgi:hypothetical protein